MNVDECECVREFDEVGWEGCTREGDAGGEWWVVCGVRAW